MIVHQEVNEERRGAQVRGCSQKKNSVNEEGTLGQVGLLAVIEKRQEREGEKKTFWGGSPRV